MGGMRRSEEEQEKVSKKKLVITTLGIALGVLIGVMIGIFFYNAPGQKANRYLDIGEKYLGELNYVDAVIQFQNAYDIDPYNTELVSAIDEHLKKMIEMAEEAGARGDFETELSILESVSAFSTERSPISDTLATVQKNIEISEKRAHISKLIEEADEDYDSGDYKDAEGKYEQAVDEGADNENVSPRLGLSKAFQKLIALCKDSDWEGIAHYVDNADFNDIITTLSNENPIFVIADKGLIIGSNTEGIYVINGDLEESVSNGNAVGVISAANTYSVYDGEWKGYKPDGSGKLTIWNKNEGIASASIFKGNMSDGVFSGDVTADSGEVKSARLDVKSGNVTVEEVDDNQNAWLSRDGGNRGIIAIDIKENGGVLEDFKNGVPCFGGSDQKLELEAKMIDSTPPVLSSGFKPGQWYSGYNRTESYDDYPDIIGYKISAIDDIDGDITERITHKAKKHPAYDEMVGGMNMDNWFYGLTVIYTVTDDAGNTATMTVEYLKDYDLGWWWGWKCVSIE